MQEAINVILYIESGLFVLVGLLSIRGWVVGRDRPHAHLALAAGLLGLAQITSVTTIVGYTSEGNPGPRALTIATGVLLLTAVYFFLAFLADFVPYPRWVHVGVIAITVANLALSFIEKPEYAFLSSKLVHFQGVRNPIPYTVAIVEGFLWLALAFGALWVAFIRYGRRLRGLPRFRMLSIGAGFLLLFIAVVIVPAVASRFASRGPSADTVRAMNLGLQILGLASAPLLLLGFAPPARLRRRFASPEAP